MSAEYENKLNNASLRFDVMFSFLLRKRGTLLT